MRRRLFQLYWVMRRVIAPSLAHSQALYETALKSHVTPESRWLDLGCGHHVLPEWREEQEQQLVANCRMVVGMDYDLPSLKKHRSISLRVRGNINLLPFPDSFFDLVTANMVVEHLADPLAQFSEISRVLKPGGHFLFHTPNTLGYPTVLAKLTPEKLKHKLIYLLDGRQEEDVFETHYSANNKSQITLLAQRTGFKVAKLKMIVSDAVFALVAPLAIPELIYIRLLMTKPLEAWRTTIIASLKKNEIASAFDLNGD